MTLKSNVFWLFSEQVVRLAFNFYTTLVVARHLGPLQFGAFSYSISIVLIISGLSSLGIDNIVLKESISRRDGGTSDINYINNAFWIKTIVSMLMYLFILVLFTFSAVSYNFLIIAVAIFFFNFNVFDLFNQSMEENKSSVYARLFSVVVAGSLKLYLVHINAKLVSFLIMFTGEAILTAVGYVFFCSKNMEILKFNFDFGIAKDLIVRGLPLMLSAIMVTIYMKVDLIMIEHYLGNKFVGLYSAAARLTELSLILPTVVSIATMPKLMSLYNKSIAEFECYLHRVLKIFSVISLSIIICAFFFSDKIIVLLYGSEYIDSAKILEIHMVGAFFAYSGVVSSRWFIINEMQKITFYRTLVGALLNVALNALLIPHVGILGAAISTVSSQAVSSYFFNMFNRKTIGLFNIQTRAFFLIGGVR